MTGGGADERGLVVLADGVQAAFAAGAVGALAASGCSWVKARGAGLGAQVAVLAALGESAEGARRWRRAAQQGVPLLLPVAVAAAQGARPGTLVLPDPWVLGGWLSEEGLDEHLAPEAAALPARLCRLGVTCEVALVDLEAGCAVWSELSVLPAEGAARNLIQASTFAGGFAPRGGEDGRETAGWGGVAAALLAGLELDPAHPWDVVCGFPAPPLRRVSAGRSLFGLIQRRDEIAAGLAVFSLSNGSAVRIICPTEADWCRLTGQKDADLAVEYPLPWERNGELTALLVDLGVLAGSGASPAP